MNFGVSIVHKPMENMKSIIDQTFNLGIFNKHFSRIFSIINLHLNFSSHMVSVNYNHEYNNYGYAIYAIYNICTVIFLAYIPVHIVFIYFTYTFYIMPQMHKIVTLLYKLYFMNTLIKITCDCFIKEFMFIMMHAASM